MLRSSLERGTSLIGSASSTPNTSTPTGVATRPSQSRWPRSAPLSSGTGLKSSAGPAVPGGSPRRADTASGEIPLSSCRVRWSSARIPGLRGHHRVPRRRSQGALRMAWLHRARQRAPLPPASSSGSCCLPGSTGRALHHAPRGRARDEVGGRCPTLEAGRPTSSTWLAPGRSPNGWVCASTTGCTRGGRATSRSLSRWRCSAPRADAKRTSGTGPMSSSGRGEPGASRRRGDRSWRLSRRMRVVQGALKQDLHSVAPGREGHGLHDAAGRRSGGGR